MSDGALICFKILGIAIGIGILGGLLYSGMNNFNQLLNSEEFREQQREKIIYEEQKNCDHNWMTLSEWDLTNNAYRIYSQCSKCGKAVR